MPQCKAKSKQTGERCRRHVKPGWEVCHYHGGGSHGGIFAPALKHGFYSKNVFFKIVNATNPYTKK